jgi:hypothetical protein
MSKLIIKKPMQLFEIIKFVSLAEVAKKGGQTGVCQFCTYI